MKLDDLKNKKIAILGGGVEGLALFDFLKSKGIHSDILDEKEKNDAFSNLSSYNYIFRSPGIKRNHKVLLDAEKNGALISSQTQLFFDLCPCPIIGVTGTKGKGTTSSLIYEMLKKQGLDAYLGGNIGTPPISFLDKLTNDSKVVLEMSSFQLQDLKSSPHIAVMLMTTSEHLDYHKDVYEYIDAKRNIFRFQTASDYAIVNKDFPASNESDVETAGHIYKVSRVQDVDQGCFVRDDWVVLRTLGKLGLSENSDNQTVRNSEFSEIKIIATKDILLPGRHNLENVCAAIVAAIFGGAKMPAIVHVLKTFKGLEHRLELVKTVKGVRYYDDSFSTTPETAIAAIEAFDAPEILILGGSSKNSDFTELGETISSAKNIKAIIGIGVEWNRIKSAFNIPHSTFKIIEGCKNMKEIVEKAHDIATLGDVVLLSPACASFGMFKNYKDRGQQFKEAVDKL